MMPMRLQLKMGTYKIRIQGATLEIRVADCPAMVCTGLCELRSLLSTTTTVALTVKFQPWDNKKPLMLQFCAGTTCLVVLLTHLNILSSCLREFLTDPEIYFMGVGISSGLTALKNSYGIDRTRGYVDVIELAARVLKKPSLCLHGLDVLAGEVGISLEEPPTSANIDWRAKVFSDEQVKYVVQDVYASYLIGTKLFAML